MQKHQRGSVIGFVVVGVLLAIAVVGGIYLVKNQLNGNMPDFSSSDEVAVVEEEVEESTDEGAGTDENQDDQTTDAPDQTSDDDVTSENEDSALPDEDDETSTPAEDEAVDEPAATEDQDNMPQTGVESTDELPQTGAGDNLYALIALGALTGSVVAFRRSNSL